MDSVIALCSGHRKTHLLGKSIPRLLAAALVLSTAVAPAMGATTPGTAPGQFSVSPTGAATYQISIPVPPGVNGLKPNVALLYNSQAGNGLLGQGWSLSGLSVISHCPQTIDQDGVAIRPLDWNTDRLCLDGQRLILVSGSYGGAGSTYRTEIDSFRLVTVTTVQPGTGGGPLSFSVVDRAGLTSTYSTVMYGGAGTSNYVPLLWLISSTTDRYGNFIDYYYDINASVPTISQGSWETVSKITYGNAAGTVVGKLFFSYTPGLRADSFSRTFAFTLVQENPVELTTITVKDGNNNVLSTFNLGYQTANPQQSPPTSAPTQLKSIQECDSGASTNCYPATTFLYDGATGGFAAGGSSNFTPLAHAANKYQVADFDGDGLPDYVYGYAGLYYVEFGNNPGVDIQIPVGVASTNDGKSQGITLQGAVTMDINGDGKQELFVPYFANPGASVDLPVWNMLVWNGQTGANANLVQENVPTTDGQALQVCIPGADTNCGSVIALAMDVLRNGQTGLFFEDDQKLYYYANAGGKLNDSLSTADTGLNYQALYGGTPGMTPVSYTSLGQAEVYIAGTGVVGWDPTSKAFQFRRAGNFGEASFPTNLWVFFLDSTGSGLTDAVVAGGTSWGVSYNTGPGFALTTSMTTCATAPAGLDNAQAQPIDWFGDGRQELIIPAPASSGGSGTWYLFEVSPFGCSFVDTTVAVPSYDPGTQVRLLDVNDDGQLDITYTTGGQTGFLLNQSRPYMINQITNGLGHNTDIGYIPLGAETLGTYVTNPFPSNAHAPQTRSYMGAMNVVKDYAVDTGTVANGKQQQIYTYYLYGGAIIDQWGRGFLGFSELQAINFNTGIYTTDLYNQNFPFAGTVISSTKAQDPSVGPGVVSESIGSGGVKVTCGKANPAEPTCEITGTPTKTYKTVFATGGNTISVTTSNYKDAYASDRIYPGVYSPYASSSTTKLYDINTGNLYETTTTNSAYQVVGSNSTIGADVMPTDITVTTSDNTPNNSGDQNTVDTQTPVAAYSKWEATCPGHPGTVTVIHSSPAVPNGLTQTETFTYDGNCFLTEDDKTIIDPAGSARYPMILTKMFVPDNYGNPLQAKVSGSYVSGDSKSQDNNGNNQRVTTMTYDPTERFPRTITNPLQQTETVTYDAWGNKLTDTDANSNTVTYTYDGFERKTKQSGPLPNVYTNWTYGACTGNCAGGTVFQVSQNGSDGSSTTTQYDELGRGLRSAHYGFSGEVVNQDTQYDLLGRTVQTSAPYKVGDTACWDVKVYDVLNRVTTEYQPINSGQCGSSASATTGSLERTIGTSYDGLTTTRTVSDPSGDTPVANEKTITTLNVLGKPASVKDQGGLSGAQVETDYGYDVWGNLTSVSPPPAQSGGTSAKVSMSYDSIGDKLSMQDPDMGSWSYTYDALGELLTQTDANGNTVTNQYDWLGRLFDRQEAEGETRWVYDVAYGAGIGKLAYTEGPLDSFGALKTNGAWEGYAYDGFGETTDKITVVGSQEYWVTNTYDDQGRVSQVVYPNMTAVNVGGTPTAPAGLMVAQVLNPDNSTSFNLAWQLNSATQNGQIFHLYRTPSSVTATINSTTPIKVPAQYEIYGGPVPNWQDNTVTKDDTYTWWLQACNDTNCSSYISQALVVVLPPTVPAINLPATVQTAMSWQVTWSTASLGQTGNPGPISYLAQYSYKGGAWTALNGTGTSATENSSGDGSYSYRVQACASGACSNFSTPSTETIAIQPSVPQNITVPGSVTPQTSPANIPINWVAPAVNGGTSNLYYTVTTFDGSKQIGVGPHQSQTNITDTESLDGVYRYLITVCDTTSQLCNSANSAQVPVTLPPTNPGVPTYYSDYNAPTWPITWVDSSTPGNPSGGTVSYTLQQSWNGGAFGDVTGAVTPPPQGSNIYSQVAKATLQSGYYQNGTYTYQLRACTSDPAVGGATACTAWIPSSGSGYVTTIAPDVPTNINVPTQSNGDGSFTVKFNAPAVNAGGVVTGYNVKVYDTACVDGGSCIDVLEALCQAAATATSCTFGPNSVPANSGYSLEIAAVDDTVKSVWVQLNLPNIWFLPAPAAPTLTSPNYTGTVSMSWSNVSGANSYDLYQSTDGTNFGPPRNIASGSGSTGTSVSGLGDGTYYFEVSACQTSTICSAPGPAASVSVLLPPTAPTGLGISPGTSYNGSFTLSWTAPAAATQYRVYRSTNGGSYAWVDTFNDSNSGSISRVESGLADGSYSFHVYAWNSAGQGPASNTVSGTVLLPPPTPSISETDASDAIHYTINWSAATATSYTLYYSGTTKTGSFPNPTAVSGYINTTATSYYTKNSSAIYYIRYYVVATNAAGSTQSAILQFVNPNAALSGGCTSCSKTNPPGPTTTSAPVSATTTSASSGQAAAPAIGQTAMVTSPSVGTPLASATTNPVLTPTSLEAIVAPRQTVDRLAALSTRPLEAFAPLPQLPALGPLPIDAMSIQSTRIIERLSLPRQLTRRHTRARPAALFAAALPVSPRQAYFLAHAGRTTAPKPGHMRRARPAKQEQVVATARYAPPIDPILSLYPPLRGDIRVLAHFVARGGAAPARVRKADVDCRDTDTDVECTTPDSPNALMVGYVYNSHGYLQKVEKLDANANPIGELWQATDETAFGQVHQQVFDAPMGSTTGAFSITDNYDTGTGMLNGTTASAADTTGGPSGLSAGYTWDGYNNLLTRTLSETVPAGQAGASPLSESFAYDTVNRMTQVTDSASNVTNMSYDNVGGIQSNGVYTGYAYGSPDSTVCSAYPFGPAHAVSSLVANGVTRNFCYDANGNLTKETGDVTRTLYWTSYNKPSSITSTIGTNTTTETFVYGPSRERLQTTVTAGSNIVTTTYIDGLFEQVQDNAGNITYKHYILAGSARVGVETVAVTSGGTTDTLSFFVQDQVGSVVAEVTEGLGGLSQQLTVYSHDPWGKARPTSGTGANLALSPGTFQPTSAVMAGQHEGFAGHEDLEDIGIVDMEGRIYDPEVGRFLSADPTVEYPESSQGYNRYTYCNSNPLSFSDPSGYSYLGDKVQEGMHVAFYAFMAYALYEGFGQYGWNEYAAAFGSASITGYESSGGDVHTAILAGFEAMAFTYVGGSSIGSGSTPTALIERSAIEGVIGGAFTEAGGGSFGDGFLGAFAGSEASGYVGQIGGDPKTTADYFSPINEASRMAVSAIVGGTASSLTGGNFTDGAIAGAMQRLFNDDELKNQISAAEKAKIKANELLKLTKYEDPPGSGNYSIGYGTQINTPEKWAVVNAGHGSITPAQAEAWFDDSISQIQSYITESVHVDLSQNQTDALGDYIYNAGSLGPKFLNFINSGDYLDATWELNARYINGQFNDRLWSRRLQEQAQFYPGQ